MAPPLKLAFLGSDPIALPALDWLAGEGSRWAQVAAAYTQPDRPAGRGQRTEPGPVKRWAEAHGIPVRQPEKLTPDETEWLAAQRFDAALVTAYGHILGDAFLGAPRLGTLNLHASLLPKYRGASPIQTAVASGERETGVTLMRIVRRLDAGPIADAERVLVGPLDTAPDVEARIATACVPLLARALPRFAGGELAFAEQDHVAATFCRRLAKEDGTLDFRAPAAVLAARINGLWPWPGCVITFAGITLRIGLADAVSPPGRVDPAPAAPGLVLGADDDGLRVATGEGVLRLRRLQRPGGKALAAAEFLRGFPLPVGACLPSRPMTALVGREPFR